MMPWVTYLLCVHEDCGVDSNSDCKAGKHGSLVVILTLLRQRWDGVCGVSWSSHN